MQAKDANKAAHLQCQTLYHWSCDRAQEVRGQRNSKTPNIRQKCHVINVDKLQLKTECLEYP